MAGKINKKITSMPSFVTAKRGLGISKTYAAITVFFVVLAIVAWNPANYRQKAFIAVPLDAIPGIVVSMAVLILFVYDKNSGVLEYMLSLGMTTRNIYMRYLKAVLLLALPVMVIFAVGDIIYIGAVFGTETAMALLPVQLLTVPFALSAVTFLTIAMMAFSSLQKTRTGSNQPIGLAIGYAVTIPAYPVALFLPFAEAMYADIALAIVIAAVALAFLAYSGKLISREKFLP